MVTGGSRGLGRQMTREPTWSSRSASSTPAKRWPRKVTERFPDRQAAAIPSHVGRWEDCNVLIDATVERFGKLDVLVELDVTAQRVVLGQRGALQGSWP